MSANPTPSRGFPKQIKAETPRSTPITQVKESPKEKPKESSKEKQSKKSKEPSKQQLEKWTSSINALLSDEDGVTAFEAFLEECEIEPGEHTKYIRFFKECNEFRKKAYELEKEAIRIYETYLEVGSEEEVSTRGKGKEVGEKLEEEGFPQKNLFDVSQQKVKEILGEGLYSNFCENLKSKYKL